MGYVLRRVVGHDPVAERCHCQETLDQRRQRVLFELSGLTRQEYEQKRFDRFDASLHPDCQAMLDATWQWLTKTPPWLVLIGSNGIGKSHLAMAATAELVDTGHLARYIAWYDLTAQLRTAMRAASDADAGYDQELRDLSEQPFLVIDEITEEEFRTPFQIAALTALMDRRYRQAYPTLVATNLTMSELQDRSKRVADRFRDGSICHVFTAEEAFSVRPLLAPAGDA